MSASPEAAAEARRWKSYALEELALARALASDKEAPARLACWHAQQAAEKALKAVLVVGSVAFPRTHNLLALRALLSAEVAGKLDIEELAELTQWAVESRYPGDWAEPDAANAQAVRDCGRGCRRGAGACRMRRLLSGPGAQAAVPLQPDSPSVPRSSHGSDSAVLDGFFSAG
jgi:HEPN domain-containing protein